MRERQVIQRILIRWQTGLLAEILDRAEPLAVDPPIIHTMVGAAWLCLSLVLPALPRDTDGLLLRAVRTQAAPCAWGRTTQAAIDARKPELSGGFGT
jgi:hypothetical protein